MILDGGGHRIQDGQDARHFANANATFHNFARASGWVPMVALMLGAGFAGPTNYAGMADFVVMVRGLSTMGIAGPALVKAATGETIDAMELGGAEVQVDRQGIADLGVESEGDAFAAARRFLAYLPGNARAAQQVVNSPRPLDRLSDSILDLAPVSTRKAYDVRKVLRELADPGSLFELKPTFAGNMVTGLARLGGRPVGFIANQPLRLGGMINSNACDKGAHSSPCATPSACPSSSFIDVPGSSIGSSAKRTSLGRRSAELVSDGAMHGAARTVVLGKGYGSGCSAMAAAAASRRTPASRGRRPRSAPCRYRARSTWPSARNTESAPDPMARRREMIEETRGRIGALRAAEGFGIDDIIDPRDTRRRLAEILNSAQPRRPQDHPPSLARSRRSDAGRLPARR